MKRLAILALGLLPATALAQAQPPSSTFQNLTVRGVAKMPAIPATDLTYAGIVNPNAIVMAPGNRVSFCPALSCIRGSSDVADVPSFYDHQRASLLVSAETQDDAHSEEQTLAVTTTINKGFVKDYAASTAFALGDNVKVGSAVYRVIQAGTTGANSAPQGTRPNAAQGGQYQVQDGTVRFQWINDIAIAAKVGSYFETKVDQGAGAAWGAAFNYHLNAVPQAGNFFQGVEIDYTNSGGTCNLGIDCTAVRLAMGGKQNTHALYVEGSTTENFTTIWGIRTAGSTLAQFAAIAEDSGSPVGLGFNINGYGSFSKALPGVHHEVAAIQDNSVSPFSLFVSGNKSIAEVYLNGSSPVGLSVAGVKSGAAIQDSSTSPVGVSLGGTYSTAQIQGQGWSVSPAGKATVTAFRVLAPSSPAANSACSIGDMVYDANYFYVCTSTNSWKRAALTAY